ncbi:MAG: hypothetical protein WC450_09565 [Candidatus Omnitrophota bacterium]
MKNMKGDLTASSMHIIQRHYSLGKYHSMNSRQALVEPIKTFV